MKGYNYSIRFGWRGREEKTAVLGGRYLKTVEALGEALPSFFRPWYISDVRALTNMSLADAYDKMTGIVENNVTRGDFGEPEPVYGYRILGENEPDTTPRTIGLRINGGSKIYNEAWLNIGPFAGASDASMATYDLFQPALLIIARHWSVDWACAQLFFSNYRNISTAPGVPPTPYSVFHIPWFCYLAAPLARGIMLPEGIPARIVPGGGLLMVPMTERLDPTNPEHMRNAHRLSLLMLEQTRGARGRG